MIDSKPFPSRVLSSSTSDIADLDTRLRNVELQTSTTTDSTDADVQVYQPQFTGTSTGTPTITGKYVQIGSLIYIAITIQPASGGDVSAPSSNTISLPAPSAGFALFPVQSGTDGNGALGNGVTSADKSTITLPNFGGIANVINISGMYLSQ